MSECEQTARSVQSFVVVDTIMNIKKDADLENAVGYFLFRVFDLISVAIISDIISVAIISGIGGASAVGAMVARARARSAGPVRRTAVVEGGGCLAVLGRWCVVVSGGGGGDGGDVDGVG